VTLSLFFVLDGKQLEDILGELRQTDMV
jgi:hypothetical protein